MESVNLDYISHCEKEKQAALINFDSFIKKEFPTLSEKIAWGMPSFYSTKHVLSFCAQKKHFGVYPGGEAVSIFKNKLEALNLKYTKGAIQIPYEIDIPYDLIKEIVEYNIKAISNREVK